MAATGFANMCPVASVAAEVADTVEELRETSAARVHGSGSTAAPPTSVRAGSTSRERRELTLALIGALEGAFVLARTLRSTEPLLAAGRALAPQYRGVALTSRSAAAVGPGEFVLVVGVLVECPRAFLGLGAAGEQTRRHSRCLAVAVVARCRGADDGIGGLDALRRQHAAVRCTQSTMPSRTAHRRSKSAPAFGALTTIRTRTTPPTASVTCNTPRRPSHSSLSASSRSSSARMSPNGTEKSTSNSTVPMISVALRVQFSNGSVVK